MSNDDESLLEESEKVVEGESELLHDLGKGLAAGLAGTIPIAILLLLKGMVGLLPDADLIGLLGGMLGGTWAGTGWAILFAGGAVVGIGFAALDSHVEHATGMGETARGALFGFLLSVVLMILFMGLNSGLSANLAVIIAVCGIIYGAATGAIYAALNPETVAT